MIGIPLCCAILDDVILDEVGDVRAAGGIQQRDNVQTVHYDGIPLPVLLLDNVVHIVQYNTDDAVHLRLNIWYIAENSCTLRYMAAAIQSTQLPLHPRKAPRYTDIDGCANLHPYS